MGEARRRLRFTHGRRHADPGGGHRRRWRPGLCGSRKERRISVRKSYQTQMTLLDQIQSALHAPGGLQQALQLTIDHFKADTGTIHLLGPDGVMHLKAASQGIPQVVLDAVRIVPIGKGMAGLAAQRKEPVTVCNIQTDASGAVRSGAKATGMEGAVVVPILKGDKAIGALGIANRTARTFSNDET